MSNKKTQNQWSQQKPQMSQVSQAKSHVTEPYMAIPKMGEMAMNEVGLQKSVQSHMSPEKNQIADSYFSPKQFGDFVLG